MHGNTRKDFEANFPLILRLFDKGKLEDSFDSEILPHPVPTRWRKSRSVVKRSSKHSAALRHIHEVESQLDFEKVFPDKKKALVITLHRYLDKRDGYFAVTNIGEFEVLALPVKGLWAAYWNGVRPKGAIGKSPAAALAKLLSLNWGSWKREQHNSRRYYSLYDFYREIFFEFAENPKKRPRNWTEKIRDVPNFHMAWNSHTPNLPKTHSPARPNFNVKVCLTHAILGKPEKSQI